MAKRKKSVKKAVKKTARKKPISKKDVRSAGRSHLKATGKIQSKLDLVLRKLVLFSILFVASIGLRIVSSSEAYIDLFTLFSILFGFLALAFLIILLIIIFMRAIKN